jgi:hypothetical protein
LALKKTIYNLQFTVAGWLALASAVITIANLLYSISFYFLFFPGPNYIFMSIAAIIPNLISIYLFIALKKLLKIKLEIDTLSRLINIIIIIYFAVLVFDQSFIIAFASVNKVAMPSQLLFLVSFLKNFFTGFNVSETTMPAALLLFGSAAFKIFLGLVLMVFGHKMNKIKDNVISLKAFPKVIKISGILYMLTNIPIISPFFGFIAQFPVSIAFSILFFRAERVTEKHFPEVPRDSAQLS